MLLMVWKTPASCVRQGYGYNNPRWHTIALLNRFAMAIAKSKVLAIVLLGRATNVVFNDSIAKVECWPRVPCRYRILLLVHYKEWNRASIVARWLQVCT